MAGGINVGGGGGGADSGGGESPGEITVSRGGIIQGPGNVLYFKRGGFVPKGTDVVPAMLSPGEMVIARDKVADAVAAMQAGSAAVKGAIKSNQPAVANQGGDSTNHVMVMPLMFEKDIDEHHLLRTMEKRLQRRIPNGASELRGMLDQLYARKRKAG